MRCGLCVGAQGMRQAERSPKLRRDPTRRVCSALPGSMVDGMGATTLATMCLRPGTAPLSAPGTPFGPTSPSTLSPTSGASTTTRLTTPGPATAETAPAHHLSSGSHRQALQAAEDLVGVVVPRQPPVVQIPDSLFWPHRFGERRAVRCPDRLPRLLCCLPQTGGGRRGPEFVIGAQRIIGPEGLCVGIEQRVTVALPGWGRCEDDGV